MHFSSHMENYVPLKLFSIKLNGSLVYNIILNGITQLGKTWIERHHKKFGWKVKLFHVENGSPHLGFSLLCCYFFSFFM